jgi:Flp pilus assembly protein TadG
MFYNYHSVRSRSESGTTFVMLTVFIVALFGFAALSLDVGNVLREQRKENTATDAGALSSVMFLTNTPQNVASVIAFAEAMANTNGVTTAEIAASNTGTIEVGIWSGGQFLANQTTNGLYTAVRVPARRKVPMNFGNVVGTGVMNPAAQSVATVGAAGTMANVIPFGVTYDQVLTNCLGHGDCYGYFLNLNDSAVGSGKQGKVDLRHYQNTGSWLADMTVNGCNCEVSVGSTPTITGNAQVRQAFESLGVGAVVAVPIVDEFDTSGNKPANVLGFIIVQITSFSGRGSNWSADVMFLAEVAGTGIGGQCPPPCTLARALVQ